jgi:hypothetical protein
MYTTRICNAIGDVPSDAALKRRANRSRLLARVARGRDDWLALYQPFAVNGYQQAQSRVLQYLFTYSALRSPRPQR